MRRHAGGIGCGARGRASQARTRAAPGLRLVANKSRPPGAWLTDDRLRSTKSAARRRKEDAANTPRLRKLVWVARRRAPRISERKCGQTKNNGCATWRATPLIFEGREREDGPTRGLAKQYG
jgi:hypothetical protein